MSCRPCGASFAPADRWPPILVEIGQRLLGKNLLLAKAFVDQFWIRSREVTNISRQATRSAFLARAPWPGTILVCR